MRGINIKKRRIEPKVKFKDGYNLSGTVNIIPTGVLHSKENNIPQEHNFGKKGIPMVACSLDNNECIKTAEIEKEELVIYKDLNNKIENLVSKYNSSKDEDILLQLGSIFWKEMRYNTLDYTNKFIK